MPKGAGCGRGTREQEANGDAIIEAEGDVAQRQVSEAVLGGSSRFLGAGSVGTLEL